ncbi:Fe-S cluster assembly protein SufB [Candidatus Dependentiae bacterium]
MTKFNKYTAPKGLSEETIKKISSRKNEPSWMLNLRLEALSHFLSVPTQKWGPDISDIDFSQICPYEGLLSSPECKWQDIPEQAKASFEKEKLQETEAKHLSGLGAQYESEMVYHSLQEECRKQGVIFLSIEEGLKKHPEIFKKYFGSVVPMDDNKFSSLNTAFWSGGSFIYVPKGVHVKMPLQTFYRIESAGLGQFERTLIIADKESFVSYVEGCTAANTPEDSLHSAVVEIVALQGARVRYTTIQNWAKNVYNLVTKRAVAHKNSLVEWIDGNFGSKVTMKYPCVILQGEGAKTEITSIASACGKNQINDSGAKAIHLASNTSSRIVSKSISANGGNSTYRGLVKIVESAENCKASVECDALILDKKSHSNTFPAMDIKNSAQITHEARVSKVEEEKLFYLQSRGISAEQAHSMIVGGFIEPFVKLLPMEFAVEMNQLLEKEIKGNAG